MRVKGADFSKWDGGAKHDQPLSWNAYMWDFTFIKVSEGLLVDPLFRLQWNEAYGLAVRGAYHYFRPSVDPKTAAAKTVEYLDHDYGELPLALDLEATDGRSDTLERAKTYLAWYEQWTGIRPLIYSSPNFLNAILKAGTKAPWMKEYKLWLAQYPFDAMDPDSARDTQIQRILTEQLMLANPVPPAPFNKVTFHQWTAKGKPEDVPGYYLGYGHKLAVDLIFYTGTLAQFVDEFELDEVPVITHPPLPTGDPMQGTVLRITNMRALANKNSDDLGDFLAGDLITFTTQQLGTDGLNWCFVTDATRNGTPIKRTSGLTVAQAPVWAWLGNIRVGTTPTTTNTPFTLTVDGFKPYTGELEKE